MCQKTQTKRQAMIHSRQVIDTVVGSTTNRSNTIRNSVRAGTDRIRTIVAASRAVATSEAEWAHVHGKIRRPT